MMSGVPVRTRPHPPGRINPHCAFCGGGPTYAPNDGWIRAYCSKQCGRAHAATGKLEGRHGKSTEYYQGLLDDINNSYALPESREKGK